MKRKITNNETSVPLPWSTSHKEFFADVQNVITHDAIAIGVINLAQPQLDEIFASKGFKDGMLEHWCHTDAANDMLITQARAQGVAIANEHNSEDQPLASAKKHVMVQLIPESLEENKWWILVLARDKKVFAPAEQKRANILIKQWQVSFSSLGENGLRRIITGHDDRLLLADPWTKALTQEHPKLMRELITTMHPILEQRWPDTPDFTQRDLAMMINEDRTWVLTHRGRAVDHEDAHYHYIELRPLDDDELTAVGVVSDDRISKAIAFLHDNYQLSPSLNTAAEAIHISPFHFHRLFSKQVGVSPKHYLQRKQLQMAKWMLRSSRTPVGTIASTTGFASHGHFTSTFHRLVGVSPTEYRESH